MSLGQFIRKVGRTAQIYAPFLQDAGKAVETQLRRLAGRAHDEDLEGLRQIDVPADALFLDVGANRGAAARSIWTICPTVRVVGFEPNPAIVERFGQIFAGHGSEIHIVGLGSQAGEFPLFVPVYRGVMFDGLASLDENEAKGWLNADTLFGFDKRRLEIRRVSCRVTKLDSFDLKPFFIKIDVQGREYEVIAGGLDTVAATRPIIFAESEALDIPRVLKLLSPWDYEVMRFDGRVFRPGEISTRNVYFVPAEKMNLVSLFT